MRGIIDHNGLRPALSAQGRPAALAPRAAPPPRGPQGDGLRHFAALRGAGAQRDRRQPAGAALFAADRPDLADPGVARPRRDQGRDRLQHLAALRGRAERAGPPQPGRASLHDQAGAKVGAAGTLGRPPRRRSASRPARPWPRSPRPWPRSGRPDRRWPRSRNRRRAPAASSSGRSRAGSYWATGPNGTACTTTASTSRRRAAQRSGPRRTAWSPIPATSCAVSATCC